MGNNAGEVRLYDTRTRAHVATVEPSSNGSMMWALAFSPDGSRLAVGYTASRAAPRSIRRSGAASSGSSIHAAGAS